MAKSVYILEDQTILRDLLVEVLSKIEGVELVGCSGNGADGLKECSELRPDVMILDLMLPGLSGTDVLKKVKTSNPDISVLVFSALYSASLVRQVMESGADGFIEKTAGLGEFREAIQAISKGRTYFSPRVQKVLRQIIINPDEARPGSELTPREREILTLIAESLTSRQIAEKLNLSVKTVQNHRNNMMQKLKIHNVAGLTAYAINSGLANPSQFNQPQNIG